MKEIDDLYEKGAYSKAFPLYLDLANQGLLSAQLKVGIMYLKGEGVQNDDCRAIEWMQKSADRGFSDSQYFLGLMYEGAHCVTENFQMAMQLYQKAADTGFAPAQVSIGNLYELGKGVPKDYQQAMKWYQRGAMLGSTDAQVSIGNLYAAEKQKDEAFLYWGIVDHVIFNQPEQGIKFYNRFLELFSNDVRGLSCRGLAFLETAQYDQSLKDLTKAISLDDRYLRVRQVLVLYWIVKRDTAKAKSEVEQALKLSPKEKEVKILEGMVMASSNEYEKAVTVYRQILDESPMDFQANLLMGQALFQIGDYGGSLDAMRIAAQTVPPDIDNEATHINRDTFTLKYLQDQANLSRLMWVADNETPLALLRLLQPALRIASLLGINIPLQRVKIDEINFDNLSVLYVKLSRFIGKNRLISDKTALLVDTKSEKIVLPLKYENEKVRIDEMVEGHDIQITGESHLQKDMSDIILHLNSDFDLQKVSLNGAELTDTPKIEGFEITSERFFKKHTIKMSLPSNIIQNPMRLIVFSRNGKTHSRKIHFQNDTLKVEHDETSMADTL